MSNPYPYVDELITDAQGRVVKVVLDLPRYQALIGAVEDASLLHAMQEVEGETPLTHEAALLELDALRRPNTCPPSSKICAPCEDRLCMGKFG